MTTAFSHVAAVQPLAHGTAAMVFTAALGAAAIGVMVLVRERASRESLRFFGFALAVATWFLPFSLMYLGPHPAWSEIWARLAYLGVPFIAPAGYQFGLAVARHPAPRFPLAALWGISVIFCVLALTTDLLVAGVRMYAWGPYPVYGPAGPPFVGFVVTVILLLVVRLSKEAARASETVRRRRMQGLTAAVVVAGFGVADFAPKFGVDVYPFGFAAFFGFVALSGWTIYRYRLVDYTPSLAADDVLETMADALLVTDPEGRVRLTNRAVTAVLGCGREAIVGRTLTEVGAELAADGVTLGDLCGGADVDRVLRIRTEGGELRDLGVATSPLRDPNGGSLGQVIVLRDITERRALEEQLVQAQKLEALGRLAGGVAHDFNNLLTAMKGNARFAIEELPEDGSARQELQLLVQTLHRASRLTRQLLTFGRREGGEPEVFRLGAVARDMEEMLRRFVGEEVELEVISADDERPVRADRGQIEQVLLNLVVNAREAMPHGGSIRIELDSVALRARIRTPDGHELPAGDYTRMRVADTGTGMTDATRRRVFEPFFSTKNRETGGGLGLATTYGIVTQAGGAITVESQPARGTRFDVYLPVLDSPVPPREAPPDPIPLPESARGTVLVVEDDAAVRRVAVRSLERAGHHVVEAGAAEEALALGIAAPEVSLVVTDARLPGMSGPALLAELRARGIEAPALLMSGLTASEIARQGPLPDGVSLLPKPFEMDALVRRAGELVGSRRPLPEPAGPPGSLR